MDPCDLSSQMTRRKFLLMSGLTVAGLGALPAWVVQAAQGLGKKTRKTLIILFQRGAADGLNIVVPFRDSIYQKARPSIRLEDPGRKGGVIDLDGQFGLHPQLASLVPLWKQGRFAIVQAAGSPDSTRSHFDAQDYMESGTPGIKNTADGWLNRALVSSPGEGKNPLSAVAISNRLPRMLRGDQPVMVTSNIDQLRNGGQAAGGSFEEMYEDSIDALLSGAIHDVKEAKQALLKLPPGGPADLEQAGYPKGKTGKDFSQLARLIKADVGLRFGFLDMGGWDHHVNEGSTEGILAKRLQEYGQGLAAFYNDIGDRAEDVVVVTMTEFGRTIEENGDAGTDHGHASVMFLFGGKLKGGKVYGRWPGLEKENRFEERDLAVTTDFRQVLSEVLKSHLGVSNLPKVFPGFQPLSPLGFLPRSA